MQQHVLSAENVDQPILEAEIVHGFVQIFSLSLSFFLKPVGLHTHTGLRRVTHGFGIDFRPVLGPLKTNLSAFSTAQTVRCVSQGLTSGPFVFKQCPTSSFRNLKYMYNG